MLILKGYLWTAILVALFCVQGRAEDCKLNELFGDKLMQRAIESDDGVCVRKAAAQIGDLEKQSLIYLGSGITPLSYGSYLGQLKSIRTLVEVGALVNHVVKYSFGAPIHYAVQNQQTKAIELLASLGANLDVTSDAINDGNDRSPLLIATQNDDYDGAKLLLNLGAQVDARQSIEMVYTPLMYASGNRHLINQAKFIDLYLNFNADVNAEIKPGGLYIAGFTALFEAVWGQCDKSIIKKLLKAGADINHSKAYGTTPLIEASKMGSIDMIMFLLKNGADINSKDDFSYSVLMAGVSSGSLDVVKKLVAAGAPLNIASKGYYDQYELQTALDMAINNNYNVIAAYLKKVGAKRASEL